MLFDLNPFCKRIRVSEHAPCNTHSVFERRHGLAKIVERGAGVQVDSSEFDI